MAKRVKINLDPSLAEPEFKRLWNKMEGLYFYRDRFNNIVNRGICVDIYGLWKYFRTLNEEMVVNRFVVSQDKESFADGGMVSLVLLKKLVSSLKRIDMTTKEITDKSIRKSIQIGNKGYLEDVSRIVFQDTKFVNFIGMLDNIYRLQLDLWTFTRLGENSYYGRKGLYIDDLDHIEIIEKCLDDLILATCDDELYDFLLYFNKNNEARNLDILNAIKMKNYLHNWTSEIMYSGDISEMPEECWIEIFRDKCLATSLSINAPYKWKHTLGYRKLITSSRSRSFFAD